jgi:hypothetical protein
MRRRDHVAELAEQIGWPVFVDRHVVKVDRVHMYDRHCSTDALFPITTVEKLLEEVVALRARQSAS